MTVCVCTRGLGGGGLGGGGGGRGGEGKGDWVLRLIRNAGTYFLISFILQNIDAGLKLCVQDFGEESEKQNTLIRDPWTMYIM